MKQSLIVPFFIAHQGCPHQCVFCNQVKIAGVSSGIPGSEDVLARIQQFRQLAPDRQLEVAFYGGTFTSLPMHVQEGLLGFLRPLLDEGSLSSVRISTRPDAIDSDIAGFLREMGVHTVELGVQSMDDTVLAKAGRGHTAEDVEKAFRILSAWGFKVGAQIMPGLPGDTAPLSIATVRRLLALEPDFLRIYPAVVLAGTELARLHRHGEYKPLELSDAVTLCKILLHYSMRASVPVIRMGLQPTEELGAEGSVIAGPYHPAFRQLVEGELYFDLLALLAQRFPPHLPVTVYCSPRRMSEVVGQLRGNLVRLHRKCGIEVQSVSADASLSPLELRVESRGGNRAGNVLDLNYNLKEYDHVV